MVYSGSSKEVRENLNATHLSLLIIISFSYIPSIDCKVVISYSQWETDNHEQLTTWKYNLRVYISICVQSSIHKINNNIKNWVAENSSEEQPQIICPLTW